MGVDNPQLVSFIVMMAGTIVGVFWFLCFANGLMSDDVKPLNIPDRIDIGYIDDPVIQPTVIAKPPKKKKKQKAQTSPLQQDCIDALVALGTKKTEARKVAARVFAEKEVTTIQQFLSEAYTKA